MKDKEQALDLIWEVDNIAREIGRTRRATFHMLANGEIPPAKKICGRWVVERSKLIAFFMGEAA